MKLLSSHQRQKLLNPVSLRAVQVFYDLFRHRPLCTSEFASDQQPFFIVGSGRSGTTLLRSVLYRHEKLDIPPETYGRIPNCVKKFYRYSGADWKDLVNIIVGEFTSFDTFHQWNIDPELVRQKLYGLKRADQSLAVILDALYREHITRHKSGATIWGDKSPFNTLRLQWIDRVFPKARYIQIIRDGRDVALSYTKAGIIENLDLAARRWMHSLDSIEKFVRKKGDSRILTVYYEQLVQQPEEVAQALCDFLGIEFQRKMLDRDPVDLGDNQREHMKNVNKPIFTDSIEKYKQQLEHSEVERMNRLMGKYLSAHGYEV